MRRRFNQAILPKAPPEKNKTENAGSVFNRWFRCILLDYGVSAREFSILIAEPYSNVIQWRCRHNPQSWGQCRIARGLERLGAGEYAELRSKIENLCARK